MTNKTAQAKRFPAKTLIALGVIVLLALVPLMGLSSYNMLICSLICIYIISTSGLDILFGYTGQISMGHAAFYAIGAYGSAIFRPRSSMMAFRSFSKCFLLILLL